MQLDQASALLSALAFTVAAQAPGQTSAPRSTAPDAMLPTSDTPLLDRAARAQFNLQAVQAGTRSIGDLTAEELQDVIDLDRMLRGGALDTRDPVQRCVDQEVQRLGGNPSRLAWRVIDLKCRDVG